MTSKIRLLLSDVDGTLVPHDKVLTPATLQAVQHLRDAGILFALTSSRPPRGLHMYLEPLALTTPIAAFNGGMIVDTQNNVLEEHTIDDDVVPVIIGVLDDHDVPVWVYRGQEWYVRDANGAHVQHEAEVCQFQPLTVANFDGVSDGVAKIVGATDDVDALTKARDGDRDCRSARASRRRIPSRTTWTSRIPTPTRARSSTTSRNASISRVTPSPPSATRTTTCRCSNDPGLSIAMGNAEDDVKASASEVTSSNEDDGFAHAVENFILSR